MYFLERIFLLQKQSWHLHVYHLPLAPSEYQKSTKDIIIISVHYWLMEDFMITKVHTN